MFVVLGRVFEQRRRRTDLTRLMAALEERCVVTWEAHVLAHALVPLIGDRHEVGIGSRPQRLDQSRERIAEVLVLALTEAVPPMMTRLRKPCS